MGERDREKERLADIASQVLADLSQSEDFPDTPTLKKKFRCPYDGSTNVQKIRAILESAMYSLTTDGKTTTTVPNSVLLSRYRPGQEPKKPYFLLLVGPAFILFGFGAAGMTARGLAAWILFLPMALLGGAAIWAFIHSSRHLNEERAAWARKSYIADHHWHCRQCGGHFEPGRPGSYFAPESAIEAIDEPSEEAPTEVKADGESEKAAPNISPFKPN